MGAARPGQATSAVLAFVCLSGPGSATITAVRAQHVVGGFRIDSYAVRLDGPDQAPGVLGRLSKSGLPKNRSGSDHVVNVKCRAHHALLAYVDLRLTRTTGADAAGGALTISYRSTGHAGTLTVPLTVSLCTRASPTDRQCAKAFFKALDS
jgi:hypothetical protein